MAQSEDKVLDGVIFSLSGYVNPERATLRDQGMSLGASYRPEFSPQCTHLVSAFEYTPRGDAARQAGICIVSGAWIQECKNASRRLPEGGS